MYVLYGYANVHISIYSRPCNEDRSLIFSGNFERKAFLNLLKINISDNKISVLFIMNSVYYLTIRSRMFVKLLSCENF